MRIILADDHTLFRDALAQYLQRAEPDIDIKTAGDFHGVMEIMSVENHIDAILLDYRMPGMEGLSGFRTLHREYCDTPVILLSGLAERRDVDHARELGASGYFPKTLSGKMMLQGLHKILNGEQYFPVDHNTGRLMSSYCSDERGARSMQISSPGEPSKPEHGYSLTPREKEVLGFLVRGASNKEIAQALGLQVVTVKLHVRGVCRKLGAKNRTQAALIAQKTNLQ